MNSRITPRQATPRPNRHRLIEALEPRQHMAADLVVTAFTIDQSINPTRLTNHTISGSATIANIGTSTATGSALLFVAIEDEPRSGDSNRWSIDNTNRIQNLGAAQSVTVTFSGRVNEHFWDNDDNATYLSAWINSNNGVVESNTENNRYRQEGTDFHVLHFDDDLNFLPSTNPINATPLAANGSAQGFIGDELSRGADIDVYVVDLTGGQPWELGVVGTNDFNTNIRVYDASWNLVGQSDQHPESNRPNDPFIHVTAGTTARYYIAVANAWNINADPRSLQGRYYGEVGGYAVYANAYTYPVVSITPGDSNVITEGSTGGFWLNRTGRTDRSLTVKWDVTGSAAPGTDVIIGDGAAANLAGYTIPIGASRVFVPIQALGDSNPDEGNEFLNFDLRFKADYNTGSPASIGLYVKENPLTTGPRATSSFFAWGDSSGMRIYVGFDDLITGYGDGDLVVQNLTTGQTITSGRAHPSPNGDAAFLFFDNGLPDGDYRATFRANTITNLSGTPNGSDYSFNFFNLRGDANHDRAVDFKDLVILAQNYNRTAGMTIATGNFDGDADVDFSDLVILAQQYGKQLTTTPPTVALKATASADGERTAKRRPASVIV